MTLNDSENYRAQQLSELIAWHRANNKKISERELNIYAAGFNAGYRKAIGTTALHGPISGGK